MKDILARVSIADHMLFQLKWAGYRTDALETAVFARQLEHIMSTTYDVEFPEVKVRSKLPVNTQVNTGALSHTFRQFESLGKAKLVSAYGATDFPNVDVKGKEFNQLIHSIGLSYGYSIQDMRAAAMAGVNLDQKKAETARMAFEQMLDELGAVGDVNMGAGTIPGITNAGGIVTSASTASGGTISSDGVTLNGSWDDPNTPVETILADLNKSQKAIFDGTKGIYGDDIELDLPTAIYSALATRARSVTFTEDSVLQYMLKQSPWLKSIDYWVQLDALGHNSAGTAGKGLGLLKARSPRVAELILPQDFEQFPPQLEGLAWRILCHGRCGGVSVRYPKAVQTLDGLQK